MTETLVTRQKISPRKCTPTKAFVRLLLGILGGHIQYHSHKIERHPSRITYEYAHGVEGAPSERKHDYRCGMLEWQPSEAFD